MRGRILVILAATAACAACDEESPFETEPVLAREAVAGFYDLAGLTFDPTGDLLGETDILARLEQEGVPQLNLYRTEDGFQLVFRDPVTGRYEVQDGTYRRLADGVRLRFPSAAVAERLLLPRDIDLVFDSLASTLAFEGEVQVPLGRLRELEPDFEDDPLSDPVPGRLGLLFVRVSL